MDDAIWAKVAQSSDDEVMDDAFWDSIFKSFDEESE
jgi:hypothetical protein